MLQNLTGWHALIVLTIVMLIFGASKLPALASSVGQSLRILKTEVAEPAPTQAAATTTRALPQMPVAQADERDAHDSGRPTTTEATAP